MKEMLNFCFIPIPRSAELSTFASEKHRASLVKDLQKPDSTIQGQIEQVITTLGRGGFCIFLALCHAIVNYS